MTQDFKGTLNGQTQTSGAWTPAVRGDSTAGTYELAVATTARYVKTGILVTLHASITLAGSVTGGGTGNLQITGIPFTKANNSVWAEGSVWTSGVDLTAGTISLSIGFVGTTEVQILVFFETHDDAAATNTPISGVSANDLISFTITYEASS